MTIPNFITFVRILLIPLFVLYMYKAGSSGRDVDFIMGNDAWVAFSVFAIASLSDYLDGYIARRSGTVTALGQFIDPLADKLLVGAALVTLVVLRGFPAWAAIVIGLREGAVSLLRWAASRRGRSMPASLAGKIKTAIQIPMVLVWLLPRSGTVSVVQDVSVYVAVVLTVVSGAFYAGRHRELLARRDEART